jgi:hypothetical protein
MTTQIFTETEESIYDLLEFIHRRPALWLTQPELVRVDAFLSGYQAALGRRHLTLRHAEPEFQRFHDWVARRLGSAESAASWYNLIRGRCANEREAFDKFFELLAEFRAGSK